MNAFNLAQSFSSWYGVLIMGSLGCLSVYMFALIIVRFVFFKQVKSNSENILTETSNAIKKRDANKLAKLKGQRASDPPVNILVSTGLLNVQLEQRELDELFRITRVRQRERLTKGLSIFGTIATISPFIGLLGTVMGIVDSFNSLAMSGAAGPNVVASGVASALWTTAAGLVVAIPSVVAYNFFKNKAKNIMVDMEVVSRELLLLFKIQNVHKLKEV